MRGALRGPLPALPGGPASHREVLPRVRDTGGAGGVRISPARAAVTGTRRRVPRRAPPAHGALLRPGRLDAALAAVRRRGVARPHRAIPAGRLRRRRALRRPRRPETRRWPAHLLRLAHRARGRPGTGGPGGPRDRGRDRAAQCHFRRRRRAALGRAHRPAHRAGRDRRRRRGLRRDGERRSAVQGEAQPDTVLITAATQRLVAGMFVVEDRGPQTLKGVREPMTLYRVVQPSGLRSRLAVATGRLTRFVGREIELATLVDRWERAQDGEGQTVVVLGEAGVGKSRLVYQFHEHLSAVPHTWLECGATPYTEGTPFHPVIALVAQGLALAPEDTAAEQLGKLEGGLRRLASAETVALLAAFLGLPPPTPLQMSPELQRRKTIDLLGVYCMLCATVHHTAISAPHATGPTSCGASPTASRRSATTSPSAPSLSSSRQTLLPLL